MKDYNTSPKGLTSMGEWEKEKREKIEKTLKLWLPKTLSFLSLSLSLSLWFSLC